MKLLMSGCHIMYRAIESLECVENSDGSWSMEVRTVSGVTHTALVADKDLGEKAIAIIERDMRNWFS